jgi:hypothetical protein
MVTEAVAAGVLFSWAAGDEVYGRSAKLRAACEDAGKGYVLAVPVSFTITAPRPPQGDRRLPGQAGPGPVLGDPHVRAGLQGPPRLPAGADRDVLAAALAADPPQDLRPRHTPDLPPHLEHLAATPPGTRPMTPLPGTTPGSASMRPRTINQEDHKPGL